MPTEVKRAARVAEAVREELGWLLTRDVRDPRLVNITITRVEMTDDLRTARIHVRVIDTEVTETKRGEVLEGLSRASGMLRREVTKRTGLRYAPELRFFYDDGQDHVSRIEALLHEVRADAKKTEG